MTVNQGNQSNENKFKSGYFWGGILVALFIGILLNWNRIFPKEQPKSLPENTVEVSAEKIGVGSMQGGTANVTIGDTYITNETTNPPRKKTYLPTITFDDFEHESLRTEILKKLKPLNYQKNIKVSFSSNPIQQRPNSNLSQFIGGKFNLYINDKECLTIGNLESIAPSESSMIKRNLNKAKSNLIDINFQNILEKVLTCIE